MKTNLGLRIKYFRELKNLGQRELASTLKVDKQTIYRWEKGKRWPEYEALEKLCKALHITMEDLFQGIAEKSRPDEPTAEQLVFALADALGDPAFQKTLATFLRSRKRAAAQE